MAKDAGASREAEGGLGVAEALLLTGLLFLATCLMLILSPFLPRRAAGVIWLLIGGSGFWLSSLATADKGGIVLHCGYALMLGTGAVMLRGWRQSSLGVGWAEGGWRGLVRPETVRGRVSPSTDARF